MADRRFPINVNRLAIKSRFLYGLSGSDEVAELEERLQNCVVLENDRIESRLAAQELECGGFGTQAAVAGNIGQVGLIIPAGAGVVVVIERIILAAPAAAQWNIRRQYTPAGATAGTAIARDTRAGSSRVPACDIRSTVNAATVGTILLRMPANLQVFDGDELVMAPSDTAGVAFWIDTGNVNQQIDVSFLWRERALENGFLS